MPKYNVQISCDLIVECASPSLYRKRFLRALLAQKLESKGFAIEISRYQAPKQPHIVLVSKAKPVARLIKRRKYARH